MWSLAPAEWLSGRLHPPSSDLEAVRKTAARIGCDLPRALTDRIRAGQPPLIHDVLAFSETTGVSLYESLLLVGHDLEDLPLLQAVLHRNRTVVLPSTIYDHTRVIEWPTPLADSDDPQRGEFLSELTARFERQLASSVDGACHPTSFYMRIGRDDTQLSPVMVPGTLVRVDTTDVGPSRSERHRSIYAVAHLGGLTCTYLDWLNERTIVLVPHHHEIPPTICRLDDEAVILGRVRSELRPMCVPAETRAVAPREHRVGRLVRPDAERQTVGRFLRSAREAIGMTHREAHELSTAIARAYDDRRFAIGVGTLSDWESQSDLPLHVAHVFSLAACYATSFGNLLRAGRVVHTDPFTATSPASLVHAARIVANLPNLSWDDVFRCGTREAVLDRSLASARYLIVNRRERGVDRGASRPTLDRPLYILSDARGRNLCSGCFADSRHLYVRPDPQLPFGVRALPRARISVRGRIVAAWREIEQIPAGVRTGPLVPRG